MLNLFEVDEKIREVENPILTKINKGEIEFKNVSFTYDTKLEADE